MKMEKLYVRENTFVCLDDVYDSITGFNPVIYNPSVMPLQAERAELLYRIIKEQTGYELTSKQLNDLTQYEIFELRSFIRELRSILPGGKK